MITRLRNRMNSDESGFTLIELLVVIIIIGILAAIAIPIFLNQQKTARDGATTSDVRNIATNVQTLLVAKPDAKGSDFELDPTATGWDLTLGDVTNKVSGSAGTKAAVADGTGGAGTFVVAAYNEDGSAYTSASAALVYDSAAGGLQSGAQNASDVFGTPTGGDGSGD